MFVLKDWGNLADFLNSNLLQGHESRSPEFKGMIADQQTAKQSRFFCPPDCVSIPALSEYLMFHSRPLNDCVCARLFVRVPSLLFKLHWTQKTLFRPQRVTKATWMWCFSHASWDKDICGGVCVCVCRFIMETERKRQGSEELDFFKICK